MISKKEERLSNMLLMTLRAYLKKKYNMPFAKCKFIRYNSEDHLVNSDVVPAIETKIGRKSYYVYQHNKDIIQIKCQLDSYFIEPLEPLQIGPADILADNIYEKIKKSIYPTFKI